MFKLKTTIPCCSCRLQNAILAADMPVLRAPRQPPTNPTYSTVNATAVLAASGAAGPKRQHLLLVVAITAQPLAVTVECDDIGGLTLDCCCKELGSLLKLLLALGLPVVEDVRSLRTSRVQCRNSNHY